MIPHVFSPIKSQDFTLRTTQVNKKFTIQKSDLYSGSLPQTGSGYKIWEGIYIGEHLKLGTDSVYPTNSFDGTYKQLVWKSIDAQYYRFPYDKTATLEHANKRFTYKFLNYSASILSIPYMDFGESIKPGSVEITGSGFTLTDDKNGNLYDVSLSTGSYSDRRNLVAYWGFNNEFRKLKNVEQTDSLNEKELVFESAIFQPDVHSVASDLHLSPGVPLNLTSSGMCMSFDSSGYLMTPHRKEFNFSKEDDFTISFWVNWSGPVGTQHATLISKNTIITEQVFGNLEKPSQNNLVQNYHYVSSSTSYKPTPIFPYHFEIEANSGNVWFMRSDGTKTVHLSGSIDLDGAGWHHYATVKSGSNIYLYQDGTIVQSGSEVDYHPINNHSLMFGLDDFAYSPTNKPFSGYLDEVRIYNKGLSTATIATLADSSSMGMYQSSIVGNVFYRSGNIVVSSLDPKYNKIFSEPSWTVKYRGTHRIYTYEALCRIKAGSFNLTMNPTALKAPNTDLLADQFTGSFNDGSTPVYFTSVGLYNAAGELLVVGKLNQAIQCREDVNLNIILNFDV